MDIKNYFQSNFWLLVITCICLVLSLLFSLFSTNVTSIDSEISQFLEKEKENIHQLLEKENNPSRLYSQFRESPYEIIIKQKDSLVFWNHHLSNTSTNKSTKENNLVLYKSIKNGRTTQVNFNYGEESACQQSIVDKYHQHLIPTDNDSAKIHLKDIDSQDHFFSISNKTNQNPSRNLSFLFSLCTLAFFLSYLSKKFKNAELASSIVILVPLLLLGLYAFFLRPYFASTYIGAYANNYSPIIGSLGDVITGIIILLYSISILKSYKIKIENWKKIKNFVAPFTVTVGFIIICHIADGFLHSPPLRYHYDQLLQYCLDGGVYICTAIILLGILFYMTILMFDRNEQSNNPTRKYLTWTIGILATYPFAFFLDIKIPFWTLSIFSLSYLLIIELYLESKARKIIYTFWWIVIFSGFLASITFYYRLDNANKVKEELIHSLYQSSTEVQDKMAITVDSILRNSDIFSQLSSLPYPSGLDQNDFHAFIKKLISNEESNINSDFVSDVLMNDSEGETLFINHFNSNFQIEKSISNGIRQGEYIYYNPFEKTHYLVYEVENGNYLTSPLQLVYKIIHSSNSVSEKVKSLNYVITKNNEIILSNGNEIVDLSLESIIKREQSEIKNDISYFVSKPSPDIKIISFEKIGGFIRPISLFSFIVSISGLLLLLLSFLNTKLSFLPEELNFHFSNTSSLRIRIQMTIILLIVFSFLIIGLVTAFYFKNVLENNSVNTQKEEISAVLNDIRTKVEGVENDNIAVLALSARIDELAHVHGRNMALFDTQGEIIKSSSNSIPLARMPYPVYQSFYNETAEWQDHKTKMFDAFTLEYVPLYYTSNNPFGFIGIHYQSINNSSKSIQEFLSTILNVYIFLFLIAGVLAIAIGNSITRPLSILSAKLKEFKLGKTNENLEWHSKDEIGNLINEYNLLTQKLEESASMLAQSERDNAWREMAKQVAHEIKNPLTPMKLSIQYLERAVQSDPSNSEALIKRVSATLVEQINNLSQIADEFSNFATMPRAENEKLVINEVVEAIHDLFRKREDMEIKMSEPINDLYVFADRNHLVRVLNNILKNAIQAIPTDKKGKIEIALKQVQDKALISVKDNGIGIPEHMKKKVFTPNFTTKSSGTGLGLAISVNMLESFNGRIYFETEDGKGTTFFVEIPLMRLQDNYPGQKRVTLE